MPANSYTTRDVRAPHHADKPGTLTVSSSSFSDGQPIPMDYVFAGCGGKNQSPQLSWRGAPAGTKSFAVTCFDPDAPTGSGYWHWLLFDLPASVTSLDAGAGTNATPGRAHGGYSDFGLHTYGGPCPPKGDGAHRYIFTVIALDVDAIHGANEKTTGATLTFMMRGHVLATGSITGTFGH